MSWRITATAAILLASTGRATDWFVDANGVQSPFTRIDQAMNVASPGDRILVLPGSYPAFQFTRGVEVIGLGTDPSQVTIARVDYHVSIPNFGYDSSLVNLAICGDTTSTNGNELAEGTLTLDGVVMCGGVFLHGHGGFYLLMHNSRLEVESGNGFLGAAFDFGGGQADIVNSWIQASDASATSGTAAGIAVRLSGGAEMRISGSEIHGGQGAAGSGAVLGGGAAIDRGIWPGFVHLRLAGGSVVRGGNAAAGGAGGAGVAITGTLTLGTSSVQGGTGSTPGADYAGTLPTLLGYDPVLSSSGGSSFAQGSTFLLPGMQTLLQSDGSLAAADLAWCFRIDSPAASNLSPLVPADTGFLGAPDRGIQVPRPIVPPTAHVPARRVYLQSFFTTPSGTVATTNPIVVTMRP